MILNDTVAAAVDGGASVSLASVAADGQIDLRACSASTAGVIGMTLPRARCLMGEGILSHTILPALGNTPLPQAALKNVKASLAAAFPFNRKGLFQP